jgi:acyl-[acyl carrier protein]--UDP-N-acetylglucosamine O-acyltransferase
VKNSFCHGENKVTVDRSVQLGNTVVVRSLCFVFDFASFFHQFIIGFH